MDVGSAETPSCDFGFAFDQFRFSDSVLRIETLPVSSPVSLLADRTSNLNLRGDDEDETIEQYILIDHIPNPSKESATQEGDPMTVAESPKQIEPETSNMDEFSAVQVKTIHISSPILAAKSPFFFKLFNDMTGDSGQQRSVTLLIDASEEDAVMDMLNFMYCNTLRSTTPAAILNVMTAADKFEVESCVKHCSQLLQSSPMSRDSAVLYLDLPLKLRKGDTVKPLADAAKNFLAAQFKDISNCEEEVLGLPLLGFEAVISSDGLQVASEDEILRLAIKWAAKHRPKIQDRIEVLNTRLLSCIRFSYLSRHILENISRSERNSASTAILRALVFSAAKPRAYSWRPIRVVEFESPRQQRVCFFDLGREDCAGLFPSGCLSTNTFCLGGREFYFCGQCYTVEGRIFPSFGLFLMARGGDAVTVEFEFASRENKSLEFAACLRVGFTFGAGQSSYGSRDLFAIPWAAFIADDSPYFIDGVLHLRATVTLVQV